MFRAAALRACKIARANEIRAASSFACSTSVASQAGAAGGPSLVRVAGPNAWVITGGAGRQQLPFAARGLSSSSSGPGGDAGKQKPVEDRLASGEDPFDAITDKIPQKPVGVVEGTSYTIVIVAALGFAAAAGWAIVKDLFVSPKEYTVFNKTLDRLQDDPRVTVRLGAPLKGFGSDSRNRHARQSIPHQVYTRNGVEHVRVQFQAKGPQAQGTVHADMYYADGDWHWHYLYVDVLPSTRIALVEAPAVPQY